MSKLTVSQAARVIGIPRTTLRGVIKRGSVSVNPDGLVDTADLEQAGYTIDPDALAREQAGQARGTAQARPTAGTPQTDILPQALDLFGQLRDEIRGELDAAHARQMRLLRLLERLSRYIARAGLPGGAAALSAPQPPQIRQPILSLLRKHPNGLELKEIAIKINSPKPLRNVLQGMYRAGLVVRVKPGVYTVAPEHRSPEA
jgi:hypothetical protein